MPQADMYKIVRFTNKADFDFTEVMGAKYGGVPYFVPSGKSMLLPKPVANHLAKHLARQTFIKKAPTRNGNETDGKGTDRPLWNDQTLEERKVSFLSDEYEEQRPAVQSEAEIIAAKIKALNEFNAQSAPTEEPQAPQEPQGVPEAPQSSVIYKDKAEVIAELTKRGIKFDARSNKTKLEALLT